VAGPSCSATGGRVAVASAVTSAKRKPSRGAVADHTPKPCLVSSKVERDGAAILEVVAGATAGS
jgi:hypothetical protein